MLRWHTKAGLINGCVWQGREEEKNFFPNKNANIFYDTSVLYCAIVDCQISLPICEL